VFFFFSNATQVIHITTPNVLAIIHKMMDWDLYDYIQLNVH